MKMTLAEALAHNRKVKDWRETPKAKTYDSALCKDGVLTVTIPMRLVNGANSREHWAVRRKRASAQRDMAAQAIPRMLLPKLPVTVKITRYGPRLMDDDGNVIACKHLRDGIADRYNVDDGSPLLKFQYAQEKGDYGVKVEIVPRGTVA